MSVIFYEGLEKRKVCKLDSDGNVVDVDQIKETGLYFRQKLKENKIEQIRQEMKRWDISIDDLR